MNHDCRPKYAVIVYYYKTKLTLDSAMYYYDPTTLIHSTMAARTINPGEEITIPCEYHLRLPVSSSYEMQMTISSVLVPSGKRV